MIFVSGIHFRCDASRWCSVSVKLIAAIGEMAKNTCEGNTSFHVLQTPSGAQRLEKKLNLPRFNLI